MLGVLVRFLWVGASGRWVWSGTGVNRALGTTEHNGLLGLRVFPVCLAPRGTPAEQVDNASRDVIV